MTDENKDMMGEAEQLENKWDGEQAPENGSACT